MEKHELYNKIQKKSEKSISSLFEYVIFVNDLEFFAEQNFDIFDKNDMISQYNSLWLELEILNSLALSEWEEDGKPKDFSKKWVKKYQTEVKELVNKLLCLLKSAFKT